MDAGKYMQMGCGFENIDPFHNMYCMTILKCCNYYWIIFDRYGDIWKIRDLRASRLEAHPGPNLFRNMLSELQLDY